MTTIQSLQHAEDIARRAFVDAVDDNADARIVDARASEYRAAGDALAFALIDEIRRVERNQAAIAEQAARVIAAR